jgi:aminoglycoside 6'-N-acetyltransferase I
MAVTPDTGEVTIRPATPKDADAWARLRYALWPDGSEADHRQEADRFFRSEEPMGLFVAADDAGLVGFAEVSIRAYAEGCRTNRIGYLEGWFVVPEMRRRGLGRRLVTAAEQWARAQGCSEFASDAEADNDLGVAAHLSLDFEDVGVVRCFRKAL